MIDLSIITLEKVVDPNYIAGCTDDELIKLLSIANTIFDLAKNELNMRFFIAEDSEK
jgi:hypothetical protein